MGYVAHSSVECNQVCSYTQTGNIKGNRTTAGKARVFCFMMDGIL